jgi:hypothetical protein
VEAELFTLLPPDRKLNVRVPVYKLGGALRRTMGGSVPPGQVGQCVVWDDDPALCHRPSSF